MQTIHRHYIINLILVAALALSILPKAVEASAIEILITTRDPAIADFVFGGENVTTVVTNVIGRESELSVLENQLFFADITYLGVPDVFRLEVSADGQSAILSSGLTGFSQSFEGATTSELQDEVEKFIRKDGSEELARIRKVVNERSVAGITDGNPIATTALFARATFDAYLSDSAVRDLAKEAKAWEWGLGSSYGRFDSQSLSGSALTVRLDGQYRINDKFRLLVTAPYHYTTVEGAKSYGAGSSLGLAWAPFGREPGQAWNWELIPLGGAVFRASEDLGAGGLLLNGGLAQRLGTRLGEKGNWELAWLSQITDYTALPLAIEGYELDTDINQQILQNGLLLSWQPSIRWTTALMWTDTRFLQAAGVAYFETAMARLSWQPDWGAITLTARNQFGPGFDSTEVSASFSFLW